ncbi:MAG: hypothetical protein RL708_298 [Bacteroidota bacterium]|jgi:hypothetical protein
MSKNHESSVITYSNSESLSARNELFKMMNEYPSTPEEKERSLGLFLRGSLLARIFGIREIYEQIVDIPGVIIDLGTWRGQTAVLCENFRAIFEPLHLNRRIVCLDTFEGYAGFGSEDKATDLHQDGTYSVETGYEKYLSDLLIVHEKNNALGNNNGKHKVIKGDCRKTLPEYFENYPNEVVALAFFDVNAFEPTLQAFEDIYAKLVPGGIIAFWQLTRDAIQAEGKVYSTKIINKYPHTLHRSKFYPGLCYFVKK